MKSVKIILAIIVIGAIAIFTVKSLTDRETIEITDDVEIAMPENPFTKRIQKDIDSLRISYGDKFFDDFYREIQYKIDGDFTLGRLGLGVTANEKWRDSLSTQLYSVYTKKFIGQTNKVFNGNEWAAKDISLIREYVKELLDSPYLVDAGSNVKNSLNNIQAILRRYDETMAFIASCRNFSYSDNSLSARFPVSEARSNISQVQSFRNGKPYNSARIQETLNDVPKKMFQAHVRYLDNKLKSWKGKYSQFSSQSDYANRLYTPLKSEIDNLLNIGGIYNTSNLKSEHQRLLKALDAESNKAYYHFQ